MNHNHTKCSHSLKFCEQCDIVYCSQCNKEWKVSTSNWSPNYFGIGGTEAMPLTGNNPNITLCSPVHTH